MRRSNSSQNPLQRELIKRNISSFCRNATFQISLSERSSRYAYPPPSCLPTTTTFQHPKNSTARLLPSLCPQWVGIPALRLRFSQSLPVPPLVISWESLPRPMVSSLLLLLLSIGNRCSSLLFVCSTLGNAAQQADAGAAVGIPGVIGKFFVARIHHRPS